MATPRTESSALRRLARASVLVIAALAATTACIAYPKQRATTTEIAVRYRLASSIAKELEAHKARAASEGREIRVRIDQSARSNSLHLTGAAGDVDELRTLVATLDVALPPR
jgi:hypothetical protein